MRKPRKYIPPCGPSDLIVFRPCIPLVDLLVGPSNHLAIGPSNHFAIGPSNHSGPSDFIGISLTNYFVSPHVLVLVENGERSLVVHTAPRPHVLLSLLETEMQVSNEMVKLAEVALATINVSLESLLVLLKDHPTAEAKVVAIVERIKVDLAKFENEHANL